MNSYIKSAFTRSALQNLCEFMFSGVEKYKIETDSYETRLKDSTDAIDNRLKKLYPNDDEYNEAYADLANALSTYQDVHMELGMKIGARLLYQLLILEE